MKIKIGILALFAIVSGVWAFFIHKSYFRGVHNRSHIAQGNHGQINCDIQRNFFWGTKDTYVHLRNVKFLWTADYFVRAKDTDIRMVPKSRGRDIDLDDSTSYTLEVVRGAVMVDFSVLEKLINERTLNYPGAALKNIRLAAGGLGDEKKIVLCGAMRFGVWIDFRMQAGIQVDRAKNRLIIKSERISVMGIPFAKEIIDVLGITLKNLVPIRGDRGITIDGNNLVIDPFVLFPAPSYSGCLDEVGILGSGLELRFKTMENFIFPTRIRNVRNDVFLVGGIVKLAAMRLVFSRTQIIDSMPEDDFEFNINDYFRQICRSSTQIVGDGSIVVLMPDYIKTVGR